MRGGIVAIALVLAGCATEAQEGSNALVEGTWAQAQLRNCTAAVAASPRYGILEKRLPRDIAFPEQLEDKSLATDEEIRAVRDMHARMEDCRLAAADQLAPSTPRLAAIIRKLNSDIQNNVQALILRIVSWGEYVERQKMLTLRFNDEVTAERQKTAANLNRAR